MCRIGILAGESPFFRRVKEGAVADAAARKFGGRLTESSKGYISHNPLAFSQRALRRIRLL